MKEYIPKDEVLAIIKSMPTDLVEEYVYEIDGVWLDDDEEKLQLSPETSTNKVDTSINTPTNTSTNGTYIRDGRLMHDLVYRGEAEVTDAEQTHDKRTETHGVCSDCISRADTIRAMCKECEYRGKCEGNCTEVAVVRGMPPAEPERPRGEWIQNAPEGQGIDPPYICSICGYAEATRTPFCEQCGADMRGDKE